MKKAFFSFIKRIHPFSSYSVTINVIIIFDPVYDNHYIYELDKLKQLIDTKSILDLSSYKLAKKYWGDKGHLNIYGRELYSQYLAKEF